MNEKNLLRLAIITSIIGILILIIISEKITPAKIQISEITEKDIDRVIKIKGEITSITQTDSLLILTIKDDTAEIKVTAFKEKDIEIKKNQIAEIEGKITLYTNQIQIEADKIKIY